jgi:hypothetical protein
MHQIATAITQQFPELRRRLRMPPYRKRWMSENYDAGL